MQAVSARVDKEALNEHGRSKVVFCVAYSKTSHNLTEQLEMGNTGEWCAVCVFIVSFAAKATQIYHSFLLSKSTILAPRLGTNNCYTPTLGGVASVASDSSIKIQ